MRPHAHESKKQPHDSILLHGGKLHNHKKIYLLSICNPCRWEPPVLYRELFWTDENTQGIDSHITASPSKAWGVEWPASLGQSAILFFLSLFVFLQPVLCFLKAALPVENLILLSCVHFLLKKSWNFSCTLMHFPFYTRQHNYSFLLFSIL